AECIGNSFLLRALLDRAHARRENMLLEARHRNPIEPRRCWKQSAVIAQKVAREAALEATIPTRATDQPGDVVIARDAFLEVLAIRDDPELQIQLRSSAEQDERREAAKAHVVDTRGHE